MLSLFLAVPLTLLSVIGPILNGCVVLAILITKQVSSANNILLLHLGVLNLILGILFLFFAVPSFTKDNWISPGPFCTLYGFLFALLHPLVLWTICGLNCDRYYAIASPLHYGHIVSRKKVFLGLSVGWLISLILCIPPFLKITPYGYVEGLISCSPTRLGKGVLIYATIYTIFTLLIPATLMVCCNIKILMIARYHRHRIASAIYEVTLSAQVTITHQRNPFFVPTVTAPSSGGPPKFRGKSAIHAVFQLVGSFLILYFPYYILVVWEAFMRSITNAPLETEIHPYFFTFSSILLMVSLPVNGFIYGVKNKTLRKTFSNYWRKKQTKSEVNQEIQARTPSTCGSRRPSLTPMGFLSKPALQRRLSEVILDKNLTSPQKNKIKRIASDIAWRPYSNTSLNLSPKEDIQHTFSCNTLQVPNDGEVSTIQDEIYIKIKKSPSKTNTAHLIFQKFFANENFKKATVVKNVLDGSPRRSPRILITRAFSEESDKPSNPNSPSKGEIMSRKHSSSATALMERKWNNKTNHENSIKEVQFSKPLLVNNRDSDSSDASDTSSGKIFMSIDGRVKLPDEEPHEDHLLLNCTVQKKIIKEDARKKTLLKQTLVNVQSHEFT